MTTYVYKHGHRLCSLIDIYNHVCLCSSNKWHSYDSDASLKNIHLHLKNKNIVDYPLNSLKIV